MEETNMNWDRRKKRKPNVDISTLVYGKIPPQARELEEAILGAIMVESDCFAVVLNLLSKGVFYVEAHNLIFDAMIGLYDANKQIDILTVMEELKRTDKLEFIGGMYALSKLTNNVVSSAHIETHCKLVLETFLKREAIKVGGELVMEGYEDGSDAFEIYDIASDKMIKVQEQVLKGQIQDMRSNAKRVYDQYESVKETGILGIKTRIKKFDEIFCGLVAPDLIILAARPSQGKTAFALSLTYNLTILDNIPCAWFSLEMDAVQLTRRLVAIDGDLSHGDIREAKLSSVDESRLFTAIDRIGKAPIYIEDNPNLNIRALRTRATILKRKHKIQYIIVDYLQLMSSVDKKGNREAEISEISRGLKVLAKELQLPIIALSQLSRQCETRPDKMPQLSDLRESGAIEQDADSVLFLMRPEFYHFTEPVEVDGKEYDVKGLCIVKAGKNRHGSVRSFATNFKGYSMRFTNHPIDIEGDANYSDIDNSSDDIPF